MPQCGDRHDTTHTNLGRVSLSRFLFEASVTARLGWSNWPPSARAYEPERSTGCGMRRTRLEVPIRTKYRGALGFAAILLTVLAVIMGNSSSVSAQYGP